jgi:release factor glutamine methyltransferase
VRIIAADFADPAIAAAGHPLGPLRASADLVIANPPYIPAGADLPPEVRADPPEALFGGADGLTAIRAIAPLALRLLRGGGVLAIEHDQTHQPQVAAILAGAACGGRRFTRVRGHDDLAGRARFVTAVATQPDAAGGRGTVG